jgi:hypothetical protein
MKHIQEVTLKKAIAMLDAVSCQYHITVDGQEFGAPIKNKTKKYSKYGFKAVTNYIRNYIDHMEVGSTVEIPFGDFDYKDLRATISSYLVKQYGKGSCTSATNLETQTIEILRVS